MPASRAFFHSIIKFPNAIKTISDDINAFDRIETPFDRIETPFDRIETPFD